MAQRKLNRTGLIALNLAFVMSSIALLLVVAGWVMPVVQQIMLFAFMWGFVESFEQLWQTITDDPIMFLRAISVSASPFVFVALIPSVVAFALGLFAGIIGLFRGQRIVILTFIALLVAVVSFVATVASLALAVGLIIWA